MSWTDERPGDRNDRLRSQTIACRESVRAAAEKPLGVSGRPSQLRVAVLSAAVTSIVVFLAVSLMTAQFVAAAGPGGLTTINETRAGSLLLLTETPGSYVEAPRLATDIDVAVSGPTARGQMTQHFHNPTEGWVEAVYVLPLPEKSAVDTLKMVVGRKAIVADIKPREEAKAIYEAARREGKRAALMTQHRPNVFTHKVANIGPGETVVVQVEWQQPIAFDAAGFRFRMPLVVAPRFNPPPIVQTVDLQPGSNGWGQVIDPVPDRKEISPPVLDPKFNAPTNPVALKVRVNAGFEIADLKSHHHEVDIEETGEGGLVKVVTLKAGAVPADRDFELTWKPHAQAVPSVGVFKERVDGKDYVLAFVTPPTQDVTRDERGQDKTAEKGQSSGAAAVRREVVFVIDNSGSMGGTSIRQAKQALQLALERLGPQDRFNVIRFDDTFDVAFSRPIEASKSNIQLARRFVANLRASGGTMMVAPMEAALQDRGAARAGEIRQVVFLTDGAIGNEAELLSLVGARRGRSRVFMVGIGSAPNSALMSRIAEAGRGTFTHIGSTAQIGERMAQLFEKLESPVVTGLTHSLDAPGADVTPAVLPDLYKGEPVVIAMQLDAAGAAELGLSGRIGNRGWSVTVPLARAQPGAGISKVWARRKIRDAEIGMRLGRIDRAEGAAVILKTALAHHLMSRLTSLVAVEDEIARPADQPLTRADVPLNLPAGWDFEKVFGPRGGLLQKARWTGEGQARDVRDGQAEMASDARPDDGVNASMSAATGQAHVNAQVAAAAKVQMARFAGVATRSAPVQNVRSQVQSVNLPRTATPAQFLLMTGLALLLTGMAWLVFVWRRQAWVRFGEAS